MLAAIALLLSLSATPAAISPGGEEVDVELVLAVDMSGSMDMEEAEIQRSGYVAAISHPDFINAVRAGMLGRVAISYFEWAGSVNETSLVDWQVIETGEDAAEFAAAIASRPVATRRGTSISNALFYGMRLIEGNGYAGLRQVIDVSGDGPNNMGPPVAPARDAAVKAGIIVNGLAILVRPSMSAGPLDTYYADCVIGGAGSFVVPVHRRDDFAVAIRQKLVMEITQRQPPARVFPTAGAASDCMIGEKLRPRYFDRFDR
ncbi:DUF1194 domain-containing protein [Pararhizobium arenae]|uniref:DUF1194 domain-containing protein n=1 Tax=Pararhizobium arenae TaxID=1856850 RepID=UPI00094AB17A|nr:DUF1194 domain-containing protein [Pararhizobium arenae]